MAREPLISEPDQFDATTPQPSVPLYRLRFPWPPAPLPAWLRGAQGTGDPADSGGGRQHACRRWLLPAGLVTAARRPGRRGRADDRGPSERTGHGQPGLAVRGAQHDGGAGGQVPEAGAERAPSAAPSPSPPGTAHPGAGQGGRRQVHDGEQQRERAAQRRAARDGRDRVQLRDRRGQLPVPPGDGAVPAVFPARATYYVPRDEPPGGPRWFAVQVGNAFTSNPQKVTSSEYLLFTQQAPGGPWQDSAEPYLLPGVSPPQVAVGDDGLATPVSAAAASLAVAPGQLAAAPRRRSTEPASPSSPSPATWPTPATGSSGRAGCPAARSPTRTPRTPAPGRNSPCGPPAAARWSSTLTRRS